MVKVMSIRLREILKERNIDQKEFAEMTRLTTRTISELCTQKTKRYPKDVIGKVATSLDITDLNELFFIEDVIVHVEEDSK